MEINYSDNLLDPLNDRVVNSVELPPIRAITQDELFDKNLIPYWKKVRDFLTREGKLKKSDIIFMISQFVELVSNEPNVIYLDDPISIVGDIHGQYYDLIKIFDVVESPDECKYCFLGDYVDRGSFSIECMILLISLKLCFPDKITLLRGNHESRQVTSYFNFYNECIYKYDVEIYEKFVSAFECLPICAILNKKIMLVHGGISPTIKSLTEILNIDRFNEVPSKGVFCDLLWSDPTESDDFQFDWIINEKRNCSYVYGFVSLANFLNSNKLISIVRAHEVQLDGFKFYKWSKKSSFPPCVTVFSAPNYCDVYNNKGAIIKFNQNKINVFQFNYNPHPYVLPDFQNTISWSLPFISEKSKILLTS